MLRISALAKTKTLPPSSKLRPNSFTSVAQKNPILHQSNRILTVGLISCYGKFQASNFATQAGSPLSKSINFTTKQPKDTASLDDLEIKKEKAPLLILVKENKDPSKTTLLQFRYVKSTVWITSAPHRGDNNPSTDKETQFDWENKLTYRIFPVDQAKLLNVLNGVENELNATSRFTSKDGAAVAVALQVKKMTNGFTLKVTNEVGGQPKTLNSNLEPADATLLVEFLRCSIRHSLGF